MKRRDTPQIMCVLAVCSILLLTGTPSARAEGVVPGGGDESLPPAPSGSRDGPSEPEDRGESIEKLDSGGPPEPAIDDPPTPPDVDSLNVSSFIPGSSIEDLQFAALLPDFIIREINKSHAHPQQFTEMGISVSVSNVGAAPTVQTSVSLYFDAIDPDFLIGSRPVDMISRNDTVFFEWVTCAAGNHSLIAVADPLNATSESNETNNVVYSTLEVVDYPSSGLPDIEGAIALQGTPEQGNTTTVEVTVSNTGYGPAANILVELWERPTDIAIGNYSLSSLAIDASDARQLNWTPSQNGTLYVEAVTDANMTIQEWREDNNDQDLGAYVVPQGGCTIWLGDYNVPRGQYVWLLRTCLRVFGNVTIDGELEVTESTVFVHMYPSGSKGVKVNFGGTLTATYSSFAACCDRMYMFFKAVAGSALSLQHSHLYWLHTAGPILPDSAGGLEVYTSLAEMENTTVYGGIGTGAYFGSQAAMDGFSNNTFSMNGMSGAVVAGADGVFRDNTFNGNKIGLVVKDTTDLAVRNSIFEDNHDLGGNGTGVLVEDASPAIEEGTNIEASRVGAWVVGSSYPVFSDCDFLDIAAWGIHAGSPPAAGMVGIEIRNSHIHMRENPPAGSASLTGVFAKNATVEMERVLVEEFTDYGVFLEGSHPRVEDSNFTPARGWIREVLVDNRTLGLPGAVVCSECTQPYVVGNNITTSIPGGDGDFYYGIDLVDSQAPSYVMGNTIVNGVCLVCVQNTGGDVGFNTLLDTVRSVAHGAGVLVRTNSMLRVHHNNFTSVSIGIRLDRESSKVQGTTMIDNNTMAYRVYPPGFQFLEWHNRSLLGKWYNQTMIDQGHILVYGGSSPLIENNTLYGHIYGISVESGGPEAPSSPLVRFNRVLNSGFRGIADGSTGGLPDVNAPEVLRNWLNDSSGTALYTGSYAAANYSLNMLNQTHGRSLILIQEFHQVSDTEWQKTNESLYTQEYGSVFIGGNATVTVWNNSVEKGNSTGILVSNIAEPEVLANRISSHVDGIAVFAESLPLLSGNSVSLNQKGISVYGPRTTRDFTLDTANEVRENYVGIYVHEDADPTHHVTLDGLSDIGENAYSVYIHSSYGSRVHGVVIDNSSTFDGKGVGVYSNMSSPLIDGDARLVDNDNGIMILGYHAVSLPHIESTRVEGGLYGVRAGNISLMIDTNFHMSNNTLSGSSEAAVAAVSDHLIERNTITSPKTGIAVFKHGGEIRNNNVSNAATCIYETDDATPELRFNNFWNCTVAVLSSNGAAPRLGEDSYSLGVNWVDNPRQHLDIRYGVYGAGLDSDVDTRIVGNTFNRTNYSVYLTSHGSDALVLLNNFTEGAYRQSHYSVNVAQSSGHFDVSWNSFWKTNYSIRSSAVDDISIDNNTIFTPLLKTETTPQGLKVYHAGVGMLVEGSGATVADNTLRYIGPFPPYNGDGILADGGLVRNNSVSRYYFGVRTYYSGAQTVIGHNTLAEDTVGVKCTECRAQITNNSISQGSDGVQVWAGSSSPYIANNTKTTGRGNRWGIFVIDGKPDIVNNSISGGRWGIVVSGGAPRIHGRNRLENNTITSAGGGYGLYVTSTSQFNVTDNNTFNDNGVAGIYLGTGTSVRIGEDNVIAYNAQSGVRIQGGNATIEDGNGIHHNQYGVYIDTMYAPWIRDNNTIHNNSVAGIYLSSSAGTFNGQIWWNDIRDNGLGISAQDPGSGRYFHAECNWWRNANGPDDPSTGPPDYWANPSGERVSDYFWYRNPDTNDPYWLQEPSLTATSCKGPQP